MSFLNDCFLRLVWRSHPSPAPETPFQRLELICPSEAESRPLPLETQGLEAQQPRF